MADETSKLGLDAAQYIAGMEQILRWTNKYSAGVKEAAVTSLAFNQAGGQMDATVQLIANSGEKINLSVAKIGRTYQVTAATIKKSIGDIRAEQAKLAADAKQTKNLANLTEFRKGTGTQIQRSIFPKGGKQTDYRSLFGDLDQLEAYVRRGEISAKRAQAIFADVQSGSSKRITKSPTQEQFRQDSLKLLADADRVRNQLQNRATKTAGNTLSGDVPGKLDSQYGKLLPSVATPAQLAQVEAAYQRIQKITSGGRISSTRLDDLISKNAQGIADPLNLAERQVVSALRKIDSAFTAAQERANKTAGRVTNRQAAFDIGKTLKSSGGDFHLGGLDVRQLEQAYAQIAKIQNLVASGKLTKDQFIGVFDAVKTGAKTNFVGAEEQARQSLTKIKGIISGELKNPFEVNISFEKSFNAFHSLIAANFALDLVERFKAFVTEAAEFQRSIALIQTITQDANLSFNQWAQGIREVSDELGKPITEVAAAGYDLLSNQVTRAADTFDVLRTAGQFARITNSKTEDSVNLLSTAINTFRLNTSDAERVAAEFFTVIDLGRVKAAGLANSGRTFEFGKTVGASIEEINASIITLTQSGIKEDNALTLLNNVFQKLLNPTKELQALYDKLGVSTGENFVKTYGFAGALIKLKEATGGSSAKLADFFNEIRGFQGIDNLISRLDIFQDSLHQLDGSLERAGEAKKKFDNLPGQQFLEQTNKVGNLFLTGIQTTVLEYTLAISKYFGGLDIAIIELTGLAGAATTAIGGFAAVIKAFDAYNAFKKAADGAILAGEAINRAAFAQTQWNIAVAAYGPAAVFAAGAAAVAYIGLKALEARDNLNGMYNALLHGQDELNKKEQEADQTSRSKGAKDFEDELTKRRQAILEYVAVAKTALASQGAELDKTGNHLKEELKNSIELALKSSKQGLQDLVNSQEAALRSITDLKKEKAALGDSQGSSLFAFAKARDQSLTGGANEKQLYQQRLDQLTKLQHRAAKTGDQEGLDKYFKEKEALVNELATARDSNGNLKYYGQEQAIRNLYAEQNKLLAQQIRLKTQQTLTNEKIIKAQTERVKTAEDAGKALFSFSLTDPKTGKPIDKNRAAAEDRLQGLKSDYDKAITAANGSSRFGRTQFNGADSAVQGQLEADRQKRVNDQFKQFFGNRGERSEGIGKESGLDEYRERSLHAFDEMVRQLKDLNKSIDESSKEFRDARAELKAGTGTLLGRDKSLERGYATSNFDIGSPNFLDSSTAASKQKDKLLDEFHGNVNTGLYGDASKTLDRIEALYKQNGALGSSFAGGVNGKSITVQESITKARAALDRTQQGDRADTANRAGLAKLSGSPEQTFSTISALFDKYGDVSARAKSLEGSKESVNYGLSVANDLFTRIPTLIKNIQSATSSAAGLTTSGRAKEVNENLPPGSHSMGGPIGYFSDGGSISDFMSGNYSRGIDTVPIMANRDEFISNPAASRRFKSQLTAMNSGFDPFTGGGGAHKSTTVGDIHVHVNGGGTSQQTIREIAAGLQREIRRGTIQL